MSGYDDILLAKLQVLLGERGTPSAKRAVRVEEISGDNVAFVTKPGGGIASLANGSLADLAVGFKTRPNTGIYLDINDLVFVEDGVEIARFTGTGVEVTGQITGTAVTQTKTDATPGRLLKTGDFGLGGLTALIGNASVIDNSLSTGFYNYDTTSGSTGGPAGVVIGLLIHSRRAAGGGETQFCISEVGGGGAGSIYARARTTGAWSAWLAPSGGGGGGAGSPITGWLA